MEKLAELGELTGHLAHEIRNPLSTVKVNLRLLSEDVASLAGIRRGTAGNAEEVLDETGKRYRRQLRKIETIEREAERLSDILNDFLKYAGRVELHQARSDINEVLDDLIDFYEPQALGQNVQIRRNLQKKPIYCSLDADLIKQAFLNLFINAVQAMGNGGELILSTQVQSDTVRVEVIDTGPGIASEEQPKIFEAYYTTKRGGTGLGLATCRRIIEEHGGHVDLYSEPGKGSNFTIVLPVLKE